MESTLCMGSQPRAGRRREVVPVAADRPRGVLAFERDFERRRRIVGVNDFRIDRAVRRIAGDFLDRVWLEPDHITIGRPTAGEGSVQLHLLVLHGIGWVMLISASVSAVGVPWPCDWFCVAPK